MKWIHILSKTKINYHIYKLNKNDNILYFNHINQNEYFIILEGVVCLFKIFNNKKKFFIGIFSINHAISLINQEKYCKYYYKLIAFNKTYLITFSLDKNKQDNINSKILFNIIQSQKLTIKKYELINCILKQQYNKYKIIQFILFLFIEFGIINNKQINISFHLSQNKLSLITGINKNKINSIVNLLINEKIIHFSSYKTIYIDNIYRLFLMYCY